MYRKHSPPPPSLRFLLSGDRNRTGSGSPRGSTWCALNDAFLLTTFVTSGYVCYLKLPVSSNLSAEWIELH